MTTVPYYKQALGNYGQSTAITPSDTVPQGTFQALYVGLSGDVTVLLTGATTATLFKSCPIGILPIQFTQVFATGTAAGSMLGLN